MTAIITKNFRIHAAAAFKAAFSDVASNLYLFIGRTKPWSNDSVPDAPIDTIDAMNSAWDEMLAMKKIAETSVSHVAKREDWVTNTRYVPYRKDDVNLFEHPTNQEITEGTIGGFEVGGFFVTTSASNVYKCLDNNRGAVSTVEPTGTATTPFRTADGYLWKYMYTISANDGAKYLTPNWFPVKTLTEDDGSAQWDVQTAAVAGAINAVRVISQGSGYTAVHSGTAQGGSISGTTLVTLAAGASASDDVYNNSTIWITGGTGSGQSAKIIDYNGTTKVATLATTLGVTPNGTSAYEILPTVEIAGNGTGAVAKPVISGGLFTRIDVQTDGSGYSSASATITGGGGSNAILAVEVSPPGGHGSDPVSELGANFIMVNVKLQYDESGDFPTQNDYRRMGIIKNVKDFAGTLSSAATRNCTQSMTVNGAVGTFVIDEIVSVQSDATIRARVVQVDAGPVLKFTQDAETGYKPFSSSQSIVGSISGATGTVASTPGNPETMKYSGQIIYMEQRRPITRSSSQQEDIKLAIEF